MSTEKEIAFMVFCKTIYEVRPKKKVSANHTHHWKIRVESLKDDSDIRKVEFQLHSTFKEPIQVRKKPPFEIEEDGFGNFTLVIKVIILNRIIPLKYLIQLFPTKVSNVVYHNSVWMVKPKEMEQVLEIGGIPIENPENPNDESKTFNKVIEYVNRHGSLPPNASFFFPKVYERVMQKIKRIEHQESVLKSLMNNPEIDMGHSDDSSITRQPPSIQKQHRHNKPPMTVFDQVIKSKPRNMDLIEPKKELKRKKNICDSSSDSDADLSHQNVFKKQTKKLDNGPSLLKVNDIKMEKSVKVKPEFKQEPNISKMPVVKIENKLQKLQKEPKMKQKFKDNNSDTFSKLFEGPDLIVINKGKVNLANATNMNHDTVKRKVDKKEHISSDHVTDDRTFLKKSHKSDKLKDSRDNPKVLKKLDHAILKPANMEVKKHKPSEKTIPLDQKKDKKSERKIKKHSSSSYSKPLSSLSSNESEVASPFSKSSSDNEIDPAFFRPKSKKKSVMDQNIGLKQLFGDDDNDMSDDDDEEEQVEEDTDLFSSLQNNSTGTKPTIGTSLNITPATKRRVEPAPVNSDEEEPDCSSSENEIPPHKPTANVQLPTNSPDLKYQNPIKQKPPPKEKSVAIVKSESTLQIPDQVIPLKERRKLAKMLLKIKNKKFFANLQRLLLTSFENREKSVSFDPETMRLDFNMGDISDELVTTIRSMVEDYLKEHDRSITIPPNGH